MTDGKSGDAILPVVVVKVDGITCRALVDSGAGSSYASAKLIDLLKKKPSATKIQRIDMLMSSRVTRIESYDVVIRSVDDSYEMDVRVTKVNKGELLRIDNPRYEQLIRKHQHLKQVEIADHDSKQQLPIHMILGSGEYARIKTETVPLVGEDGDPVAELTKFGWFVMSLGADFDKTTVLMTQTSQSDYENLCRLNVLGIADSGENDQEMVYQDFKEKKAEAGEKQQLKTVDKKPAKESTPDKSQDNSQPEKLPKQPNSDKEPQPASNAPPAQDTQPNYQANNQAPGLTFSAQQANNGENKPIKDSNPEKSEQNSQTPQQLNPTNGQQQNFAAENLDTKDKQKPIEESAPLKPNLKDGKQQVEDQPKPAANSKPASGVKSKGKSPVGVPAYSYTDLVKQELEAIKDSPSTKLKQFKADVSKEVKVKLKSGTFPQIDTSKVFVKHKVAKPNRKHRVTKPKHKKAEAKHAIAHKKGQGKHATVHKKDEAKHGIAHNHRKLHGRKKKGRKAVKKAKLHRRKKKHHFKRIGDELEEVVIDVETALNNRSLSYVEDDVELPVLTPYSMMFLNNNNVPELDPHHIEDGDLRRRARFLKQCKEAMWKRWSREYVRGLREQHRRATSNEQTTHPQVGEAVIIKDE